MLSAILGEFRRLPGESGEKDPPNTGRRLSSALPSGGSFLGTWQTRVERAPSCGPSPFRPPVAPP